MRSPSNTLASVLLALLVLAGCGAEESTEPGADADAGSDVDLVEDTPPVDLGDSGVDGETGEAGGGPIECTEDIDCIDENPCTTDVCDAGVCEYLPSSTRTPTQIPGNCRLEACDGAILVLTPDDDDLPADDGFECTEQRCFGGDLIVDTDSRLCDDEVRCNGVEVCDTLVGCRPGPAADFDGDGIADTEDPTPPDADRDGITDCEDVETCDGIDNDSNGLVDDFPTDERLGEACYEGPAGSDGTGVCTPGVIACTNGRLTCAGQIVPDVEFCDGLDNDCDGDVPAEELDANCRTEITFSADGSDPPETMLVEFPTALREVDVLFNTDTTGSMSGTLNTLRSTLASDIVPGVADVIPSAAFGASTFEDYPLGSFGSPPRDYPFELYQRITTQVGLVQAALSAISLGAGNDIAESGIESLYQIATGSGTRWPRTGSSAGPDPGSRNGWIGVIDIAADVDYYRFEASPSQRVQIDIDASVIGGGVDLFIELYDGSRTLIAFNDNADGADPALDLTLPPASIAPYYLNIRPNIAGATGWYSAQVLLGGTPLVPDASSCTELEVGGDHLTGAGGAVDLVPMATVTPRSDPGGCFRDCQSFIGAVDGSAWIRSYCFAGGASSCGDGVVDDFEDCDDGGRASGDGCSSTCSFETDGVPRFASALGYDAALGHGARGGVGFRENSLPIIVHATDAVSHAPEDYTRFDARIEVHGIDETFFELQKLGARIIGIGTSSVASADIMNPLYPPGMAFRTGGIVPPCAFDGSEPRESGICREGQCCTGLNGAGVAPPAGADGMCVLSFTMSSSGGGLSDAIVRGIQALARFATYTVTPVIRDDPANPRDARCFIQTVEVAQVTLPDTCVPELRYADRDGDGADETILNATPRIRVIYAINVENRDSRDFDGDLDTEEPCGPPGTYKVRIDLTGDDITVLSSHVLTFTVTDEEVSE